jgi:GNAT superfamily N-acetyltransferase
MKADIKIKVASVAELDGILALQSANQASNGGMLSGELGRGQIEAMMKDMPQIVAISDDQVVGYLLTTSQAVYQKQPVQILDAMLSAYSGAADSYIYGPICVSKDQRGKGLAQLMFKELLLQVPNREGILFIRRDNAPSLRAHEKMGIKKVDSFVFKDIIFDVLAYLSVPDDDNK